LKKQPGSCTEVIDILKDLVFKLDDTLSKEKEWLENFKKINFDTDHNKEIQKMLIDSHAIHIISKSNVLEILKFAIDTGLKKQSKKSNTKKIPSSTTML
jgi:hypothetical protein